MSQLPFPADALSPAARHVLLINATDAYRSLVTRDGNGPIEARDVLESLKPAEAVSGTVVDHNAAACVVAALWLWHDYLEAAHTIVQAVETPTGSLWHAILHRREGDFSNAKYWYRRAGPHPALTSLRSTAVEVIQSLPADKSMLRLAPGDKWNADAFVDLCENVAQTPHDPRHEPAITLQKAEWQAALAATLRQAVDS